MNTEPITINLDELVTAILERIERPLVPDWVAEEIEKLDADQARRRDRYRAEARRQRQP